MKNRRIPIKKLIKHPKRALKEILQQGEEILLTKNGRTILKIGPITEEERGKVDMLDKLAQMPDVRVGSHMPVRIPEGIQLEGEGPTASEMILEDRT
jgi:antitoxin (DNA-binding transcriptional repressor) of toxin-antitoxin stability system